jgi:iron(III) transport system substrate-binding protein
VTGCADSSGPEVVAYVAVDQNLAEPILKKFEAQSGISVRAVYDAEAAKTSGLVARLLAESSRPRCDVFWNNEQSQTLLLASRGALAGYRPPAAGPLRAADDTWTAVAARARVIVYNTRCLSREQAPQTLEELTGPQWRGRVAIASPQFGTTRTHVAALFAVWGPDRAQRWLGALLANEVRIVDGNAMVKNLVARGAPDSPGVWLGLTDTDDVVAGQADGQPLAMVYPDQAGMGTLVVPTTIGLIRGGPHPEAARSLIDFLAGPEAERELIEGRGAFFALRDPSELALQSTRLERPKAMDVSLEELLQQLEPSSRWTQEHFHP